MVMLPGLNTHKFTLDRPTVGRDGEGRAGRGHEPVGSGVGHLEVLSTSARNRAAQAGQTVDAALETMSRVEFRAGDRLTCRGRQWTVQAVDDLRAPVRVLVSQNTRAA